jgi:hypothetical protein
MGLRIGTRSGAGRSMDRDCVSGADASSGLVSSLGLLAPFRLPSAAESLFFESPKKSNQKKGDPTLAPSRWSRLGALRCSPDGGRRLTRPSMASNRGAFPRRPSALLGAIDGTRDQEQQQRQQPEQELDPGVRWDDGVERTVGWADKPSASFSAPSIAGLPSPAYGAAALAADLALALALALARAFDLRPRMPRRRAGGFARSGAHRMCASFPSVHGCTVGKPRRPDAYPRAARARYPGRLSFGYFSLAIQRKVTRTPKADETGREDRRTRRIPNSHRRTARMNEAMHTRLPKADETARGARHSRRIPSSQRPTRKIAQLKRIVRAAIPDRPTPSSIPSSATR